MNQQFIGIKVANKHAKGVSTSLMSKYKLDAIFNSQLGIDFHVL